MSTFPRDILIRRWLHDRKNRGKNSACDGTNNSIRYRPPARRLRRPAAWGTADGRCCIQSYLRPIDGDCPRPGYPRWYAGSRRSPARFRSLAWPPGSPKRGRGRPCSPPRPLRVPSLAASRPFWGEMPPAQPREYRNRTWRGTNPPYSPECRASPRHTPPRPTSPPPVKPPSSTGSVSRPSPTLRASSIPPSSAQAPRRRHCAVPQIPPITDSGNISTKNRTHHRKIGPADLSDGSE